MSLVPVPDLRYVIDEEPGLRRRRAGRSFRYVDADGASVHDVTTLARVRALAIPPAWTDGRAWRAGDGRVQARGHVARGRRRYRFRPRRGAARARVRCREVAGVGGGLPRVRGRRERDGARPRASRPV